MQRSFRTHSTRCFIGLCLVAGSILAACESSSSSGGDGVRFDAGPVFDAAQAAPDGGAAAPPFEGVWEAVQNGAKVELSNAGGCTLIRSSVNGTLCDVCVGSYVVSDTSTATTVVKCQAVDPCSVSPPHTNTGTFTRGDGGALTYFYDYGFGKTSLEVEPTPRAPGEVCSIIDAGASD